MENEKTFKLSIPKEEEDGLLSLFMDMDIEGQVLKATVEMCSQKVYLCVSHQPTDYFSSLIMMVQL